VAALQNDIDERIGNRRHTGLRHQRQQLRDVIVVHRVHGREVGAGDASVEPKPLGLADQRLDVAGERIVGLIAMQIDAQSARGGDLAQRPHRGGAVGHGALEMRNAADDLHAAIERPLEIRRHRGRAKIAVLRKGDELEVEIGRNLAFDFEQGVDR
jgi:hypothetical protein